MAEYRRPLRQGAGLEDILSQKSSQGGAAVSSVNLARGDSRAYVATHDPAVWSGNVEAISIDTDTGAIGITAAWSAAALLGIRDWTTRVIANYTGGAGASFSEGTVGSTVNPSAVYGSTADVMNHLRSNRRKEGSSFRSATA